MATMGDGFGAGIVSGATSFGATCFGPAFDSVAMGEDDATGFGSGDRAGECPRDGDGGVGAGVFWRDGAGSGVVVVTGAGLALAAGISSAFL